MIERFWTWLAAWLHDRPGLIKLLIAHCKKHPYFHIYDAGGFLYMARFWLVKERWWLPFAIRLHEWHQADDGRHLHDHPCAFRTILLQGWYVERDADGKGYVHVAGETVAHSREYLHTVDAISATEMTYSLFIYWGKHQMWGFMVDGKKVPWQEYLKDKSGDYPDEYHEKRGAP